MCGVVGRRPARPARVRGRRRRRARRSSRCSTAARSRPGVAVSDGEQLMVYKDLGLVAQVLDERRLPSPPWRPRDRPLPLLDDRLDGLGEHPADVPARAAAAGRHRPQRQPRQHPRAARARCPAARPTAGTTDTELLTALLADEPGGRPRRRAPARAADACAAPTRSSSSMSGGSSACATRTASGRWSSAACRVRRTTRPRCAPGLLGATTTRPRLGARLETAALDIVGAEYVRDVEPGEIVVLEPGRRPRSIRFAEATPAPVRLRADLLRPPRLVHAGPQPVRGAPADGQELAREQPVDADLVMPVPDTGRRPPPGSRRRAGIPYREGMVKNRYIGRTFIQPRRRCASAASP